MINPFATDIAIFKSLAAKFIGGAVATSTGSQTVHTAGQMTGLAKDGYHFLFNGMGGGGIDMTWFIISIKVAVFGYILLILIKEIQAWRARRG